MDSAIQGLIVAAIVFPVKVIIDKLWELSNEPPAPEVWLMWSGLKVFLFGSMHWRFREPGHAHQQQQQQQGAAADAAAAAPPPPLWKRRVARVGRSPFDLTLELFAILLEALAAPLLRLAGRGRKAAAELKYQPTAGNPVAAAAGGKDPPLPRNLLAPARGAQPGAKDASGGSPLPAAGALGLARLSPADDELRRRDSPALPVSEGAVEMTEEAPGTGGGAGGLGGPTISFSLAAASGSGSGRGAARRAALTPRERAERMAERARGAQLGSAREQRWSLLKGVASVYICWVRAHTRLLRHPSLSCRTTCPSDSHPRADN